FRVDRQQLFERERLVGRRLRRRRLGWRQRDGGPPEQGHQRQGCTPANHRGLLASPPVAPRHSTAGGPTTSNPSAWAERYYSPMRVKVTRLRPSVPLPAYATPGA